MVRPFIIYYGSNEKNDDDTYAKDLIELKNFIINIIESKPEYKRLPPRRDGYD